VPVIAVGRLGDPAIAAQAIESDKADFIALGRSLIADPQWVEKLRRNEPVRRCLACNTCVNEMRGGAALHCVVNAAAGRELRFAAASGPSGERIAVVGAGPAGLTYAALVAAANTVTVPCPSMENTLPAISNGDAEVGSPPARARHFSSPPLAS
jgi:hypothetical protein